MGPGSRFDQADSISRCIDTEKTWLQIVTDLVFTKVEWNFSLK
jgi:hypothetical protein